MNSRRIEILGIFIDNLTMKEVIFSIEELIHNNIGAFLVTPNVDHMVRLQKDRNFRNIYKEAALVLADGMPIIWASKFLKTPLKEKVSGSDVVPKIFELAVEKGYKIFFLGGRPGAAQKSKEKLEDKFPLIKIVGAYAPPFGFELDQDENNKIVRMIIEAKPDILLVGLGAPKQEKWIYTYRQEIGVPVSIGVGVTFEFLSGFVRRAPLWMQQFGLEWFWRLMMEPGRLWKRYIIDDLIFFWFVLEQKLGLRRKAKINSL